MDNTVGSLELPNVVRARKNLSLTLTDMQKQMLIGAILGDAYITKEGKIRFEQGGKNKEYLFWLYDTLSTLTYPAKPRMMSRFNEKYGVEYISFRFSLRQYFKKWRLLFYPHDRKVFPKNLILTPAALAVWYMDDGCWTGSKALISIEGFDDASQHEIQTVFREQLGIETIIGKNRKLLIRKKDHERFYGLIRPYVIACMAYKTP